jgi:hypothetical protein
MPFIPANFPDQVWSALKTWAKSQAGAETLPTLEDCSASVKRIAESISGHPNALRADVVAFYADETQAMISKFREQLPAHDVEQAS